MAATTTPGVPFTKFKTLIESAITRRSNFSYTHRKAIHFHWANDNTHPDLDLLSLEKMCEHIGFDKPDSHVLEESNPLPGYTMRSKIDDEVKAAIHRPDRTILIIHYAGHGTDNGSGELVLSDRWGKKLARADFLLAPVESTELASDAPIDVLYIFDCCFSFLSTRQINARSRLVEVLAANDYRNPSALGPLSGHSFTSKLYLEVRDRAQRGEKLIEIAQIMDKLQQSAVVRAPSVTLICQNKPYTWNDPSQRAHFTGSVENSGVNDENEPPCNTHRTCNIQKYF